MPRIVRKPPGSKPDNYIACWHNQDSLEDAIDAMQAEINKAIAQGYEPLGNVSIVVVHRPGRWKKRECTNGTYYVVEDEEDRFTITQSFRLAPVS